MRVSFFESAFAPAALPRSVGWEALATRLQTHLAPPELPPWCPACRTRLRHWSPCPRCGGAVAPCKQALPAWSPIAYRADVRRAAAAFEVSALVLDYDGTVSLDAARERWAHAQCVGYTTWSHADPAAARVRLVVPLAEPVPAARWAAVWRWACALDTDHDTTCGDLARLHFLPFLRFGQEPAAWRHDGPYLRLPAEALTAEPSHATRREPSRRKASKRITDPDERRALMVAAGGVAAGEGNAERVRKITCPRCGRPSAWGYVQPSGWAGVGCEHRSSCGWTGWPDQLGVGA